MTKTQTTREILADLVGFDTTSARSNLALIEHVRAYLASHGVTAEIFPSPDGEKASLWATIGPCAPGGIILSGHTDCVPVEGQAVDWDESQPGVLYGISRPNREVLAMRVLPAK